MSGGRVTEHELKVWPEYFEPMARGAKSFEVRFDDRGFKVGDVLRLREWTSGDGYSGRELRRTVAYVLRCDLWLRPGFVVLALGDPPAPLLDLSPDDLLRRLVITFDAKERDGLACDVEIALEEEFSELVAEARRRFGFVLAEGE